jgi:hypothetical protein
LHVSFCPSEQTSLPKQLDACLFFKSRLLIYKILAYSIRFEKTRESVLFISCLEEKGLASLLLLLDDSHKGLFYQMQNYL